MTSHTDKQTSTHSVDELFTLVADVARYPEFLPWCRAARVFDRKQHEFMGELIISFSGMTESYTSRVELQPASVADPVARINVTMVKGPFEHLVNRWVFTPKGEGCEIDFFIDFKFRSKILEKLIGGLFAKASNKMMDAFKTRADQLYGKF